MLLKILAGFPDLSKEDRIKIQNVVVGEGITCLGSNLFAGLMDLESVSLPESLEIIRDYTFLNCTALKQITLPSDLMMIGEYAFSDCTHLETVTINKNSELVGKDTSGNYKVWMETNSFKNCSSLKNVYIYCDNSKDRSAHTRLVNYINKNYNAEKTIKITVKHSETLAISRVVKEATCENPGEKYMKCTNCNKEIGNKVEIPKLGHDLKEVIDTKAGCVTAGKKHYYCQRENCSYCSKDEVIPSLGGHKYVTTEIKGTCDNPGTITKKCSECGDTTTVTGTTTEHVWKETSRVNADCKTGTDGSVEYICENCGETDTKTITASHDFGGSVVAQEATCTEPGYLRLSL